MATENKLNPASIQANKLIAKLPEQRDNINTTSIQFRNDLL